MKTSRHKSHHMLPALVIMSVVLGGCSYLPFSSGPEFTTLTGQADSEERMTLPADAEFDVKLIDVSDGRETLAVINQRRPGQFPLTFTLQYDRSQLAPEHEYALDASVRIGGQLSYINVEPVSVLTGGAPRSDVTITLERVH
ncbi:YbaY family lipoprotein [Phytohalomonas tamaricis]|uniref:YbaY family lipoprotein n=1 Tax=Phytohalomonas tamaricis TaxID=2081032 RepID=UPI000D0BE8B6|nr:YbaY family lipoprotein [Phytohalomonas tamaricis]